MCHSLEETTMNLRQLIVLACTLLAVSACVVEPWGYEGGRRGNFYGGGEHGEHDYGRRVWRE
jgi:hypothetical protein